jgi:hypothetical protein
VVTGIGAKSFGPVTRVPGRLAEVPPGSETLTEAAFVAESATGLLYRQLRPASPQSRAGGPVKAENYFVADIVIARRPA